MALREKMYPCQSREAMIAVQSYHDGIMDAYVRHPRLAGSGRVRSLSQLLLLMGSLLDMEDCPNPSPPLVSLEDGEKEGAAVFRIQILFREHYTWQGKLVWQDEDREYVFRSALELIQLMDEILGE